MNKIAILIIATNQYRKLAQSLIDSIDEFYKTDNTKDIFLFSDKNEFTSKNENIIFNEIKHEPWPYVTLKRFEYFSLVSKDLRDYDLVIYMDCDLQIVKNVEFPHCELLGVTHPAKFYYPDFWDVDKNPNSKAYIPEPFDPHLVYHQGCLWGGSGEQIYKLITTLQNNTQIDLDNDVVAKWHDESHLNRYFFDNQSIVTTLSSSYCYPENWNLPIEKLIIHKDKSMQEFPRHSGK